MEIIKVNDLSEIIEEKVIFNSSILQAGDILEIPDHLKLFVGDMCSNSTIESYLRLQYTDPPFIRSFIILGYESHSEIKVHANVAFPSAGGKILIHCRLEFKIKIEELIPNIDYLGITRLKYGYAAEDDEMLMIPMTGVTKKITRTTLRNRDIITFSKKGQPMMRGMIEIDPSLDTLFRYIKVRMFKNNDTLEIEESDILNGTYTIHTIHRISHLSSKA